MPQTGSILVRVYLSRAQLPIAGATVIVAAVTPQGNHQVLSIRATDASGLAGPITLPAPDLGNSDAPGGPTPFTNYTLVVEHPDYELATFEDVQVFPGIQTVQDVPLVPLTGQNLGELVTVTPQPL
ncbi:MAG TPA: spore cortex-lytic protein [Clostridiales bacterium]|nr:spore cortex-lytic protein [Clostridiales bacterium]